MESTVFSIFIHLMIVQCSRAQSGLIQSLHVFSRHGARTPELKDVYPNDPYKLETFLPMGYGQLTEHGKWQSHRICELLRAKYEAFFVNVTSPNMVYALSTDYDRTKATAAAILAGIFSGSTSERELPLLIRINHKEAASDFFLQRPNSYCPSYLSELNEVLTSEDVLNYVVEKSSLFENLTLHTGKSVRTLQDVFDLYQTLTAEATMNLTLPEWTEIAYPEEITNVAVKRCQLENSKPLLKRLNGGRSLEMILRNIVARNTERKLFLYTGHENNINNILYALEMADEMNFPNYGATVVFELHAIENQQEYAVKVVHMNGPAEKFMVKQLNGCDILCPLSKFKELTRDVVPVNYTRECGSTTNLDP